MVVKMRDAHIKKLKTSMKGELTLDELREAEIEGLRAEVEELQGQLAKGTEVAHLKAENMRLSKELAAQVSDAARDRCHIGGWLVCVSSGM